MSVQYQSEETPEYLAVRFIGATREVYEQIELIAEHCERASKNKLLLDITDTHGEFSLVERFWLGDQAETLKFHHLIKVAVVSRPEQLDRNKFGEMVARNRRLNARGCTNVRAAEKWLLLKPAARRTRSPRAIIIPQNLADYTHH